MTDPQVESAVVTAIKVIGGGILALLARWVWFRITLDGRFAIGANEEMVALRAELRSEIKELRLELEGVRITNRNLLIEKAASEHLIKEMQEIQVLDRRLISELQESQVIDRKRIGELEEHNHKLEGENIILLRRVSSLEDSVNGPTR